MCVTSVCTCSSGGSMKVNMMVVAVSSRSVCTRWCWQVYASQCVLICSMLINLPTYNIAHSGVAPDTRMTCTMSTHFFLLKKHERMECSMSAHFVFLKKLSCHQQRMECTMSTHFFSFKNSKICNTQKRVKMRKIT